MHPRNRLLHLILPKDAGTTANEIEVAGDQRLTASRKLVGDSASGPRSDDDQSKARIRAPLASASAAPVGIRTCGHEALAR
jgi:hypothetical protein